MPIIRSSSLVAISVLLLAFGVLSPIGAVPLGAADATKAPKAGAPATTAAATAPAPTIATISMALADSNYADTKAIQYMSMSAHADAAEGAAPDLSSISIPATGALADAIIARINLLIHARTLGVPASDFAIYLNPTATAAAPNAPTDKPAQSPSTAVAFSPPAGLLTSKDGTDQTVTISAPKNLVVKFTEDDGTNAPGTEPTPTPYTSPIPVKHWNTKISATAEDSSGKSLGPAISATYTVSYPPIPSGNAELDAAATAIGDERIIRKLGSLADYIVSEFNTYNKAIANKGKPIPVANSAAIDRYTTAKLHDLFDQESTYPYPRVTPASNSGAYVTARVRLDLQSPGTIPALAPAADALAASGIVVPTDQPTTPPTASAPSAPSPSNPATTSADLDKEISLEQADVEAAAAAAAKVPPADSTTTAAATGGGTTAPGAGAAAKAPNPAPAAPTADQPSTAQGSVPNSGTGNTQALASGKIQVGSDLKLVSATLFQGRAYLFKYPNALNFTLTSSLPATVPDLSKSTEYSDAELQTIDGGAVNLRIGLLSSLLQNIGVGPFTRADYALPNSGIQFYGDRSDSFDRYYLNGGTTVDESSASQLDITTGRLLGYFRDGLDTKLIYRGSNATVASAGANVITTSTSAGDYGASAGYYAGVGIDGGLYGPKDAFFKTVNPAGSYRVEGLFEYQYVDKTSLFNYTQLPASMTPSGSAVPASIAAGGLYPKIASLYAENTAAVKNPAATPHFKYPGQNLLSAEGSLSITIGKNVSIGITAAWPLGGSRGYMGKTLLGSVTISSLSGTPAPTSKP